MDKMTQRKKAEQGAASNHLPRGADWWMLHLPRQRSCHGSCLPFVAVGGGWAWTFGNEMNTTRIWSDIDAKEALKKEIEKDVRKSLIGNPDLNYSLDPAMRKIVSAEIKRIMKIKYSPQNTMSKFMLNSEIGILHWHYSEYGNQKAEQGAALNSRHAGVVGGGCISRARGTGTPAAGSSGWREWVSFDVSLKLW
jgi:hypothetical protein